MRRVLAVIFLLAFPVITLADRSGDVLIPPEIFDRIKTEYSLTKEKALKVVFIDMEVAFKGTELDQKKILGASQRILDLSSMITSRHKNFKMTLTTTEPIPGNTRLFFMSQYQPQSVGNNTFGMECGKALLINTHTPELSTEGVSVSNFSSHYIHVLGGDYLLTALEGTTLRVGYFKIRDGRMLQKLCRVGA